jgi:hypothetical protein
MRTASASWKKSSDGSPRIHAGELGFQAERFARAILLRLQPRVFEIFLAGQGIPGLKRVCEHGKETAGPSTTLPRISCPVWWRWRTSRGFLYGKPHTWLRVVPRCRKSGSAPVGMTILFCPTKAQREYLACNKIVIPTGAKRSGGTCCFFPVLTHSL